MHLLHKPFVLSSSLVNAMLLFFLYLPFFDAHGSYAGGLLGSCLMQVNSESFLYNPLIFGLGT